MAAIGNEPQGEGAEGAAPEAGSQETPGSNVEQMLTQFGSRLDELGTTIQGIVQQPPAPVAEEEGEEEFELPQFSIEDYDEDGQLSPEAQAREIARLVQQGVEEALAPEREERAWERRDQEADALEERYPDLAGEKQEHYLQLAQQKAQALGQPTLAIEPSFLEMVYLEAQAREKAGDEIPAGSRQEVSVERGGTVQPVSADGPGDDGDRIVSLARSKHHRVGS
jgi:hypothetical protein